MQGAPGATRLCQRRGATLTPRDSRRQFAVGAGQGHRRSRRWRMHRSRSRSPPCAHERVAPGARDAELVRRLRRLISEGGHSHVRLSPKLSGKADVEACPPWLSSFFVRKQHYLYCRAAQPWPSRTNLTARNVLPPCVRVIAGGASDVDATRTFIWGVCEERTPCEEDINRIGS